MHFIMKFCLVCTLFGFHEAAALEGHLGEGHDTWHQRFYRTLDRPDTKEPCCSLTDCRPTSGRQVGDHYEVKVNGAWVSVPPNKILKRRHQTSDFMYVPLLNSMGAPNAYTVSLYRRKSRAAPARRRRCLCRGAPV